MIDKERQHRLRAFFKVKIPTLLPYPRRTRELYALMQEAYPEHCDDTIMHECNSATTCREWRHMLRRAQQDLQNEGVILLEAGRWRLL